MQTLEFRLLNTSDKTQLENLLKITSKNVQNPKFWLPISHVSKEHFLDKSWTVFNGCFINDELVATAGLFINPHEYSDSLQYLNLGDCEVAELGRLMVEPTCQGNHLSYHVSKTLIEIARQRGVEYLIATSHPNNIPSQKILHKLGFEKKSYFVKNFNYQRDILVKKL